MDAHLVKHHADQFAGAFADIAGTIRFCERQLWDASCDHSMKPETEELLTAVARALSLILRLTDWEVQEMEKLGIAAQEEIDGTKRRASA